MHRKNSFFRKPGVFLIIFLALSAIGFTYADWHSSLFVEAKITSGVMDIVFGRQADEKYNVSVTDADGNDAVLVDAEFNIGEKEMEVSFNEGLPINLLMEGKFLKLEFLLTPSKDSTVTKVNYTKFDPLKKGESLELKVDKALLVNEGTGYSLGENEDAFLEPLKFEVYKALIDDNEDEVGQIYLKLQEESIERLKNLPVNFSLRSDELVEYADLDLKERDLISKIGDGVVVTYSFEIPFDILQRVKTQSVEE